MRVFLLGRTEFLYDTALALSAAGHEIVAVVTAKSSPEYQRNENDFRELAETHGAFFICAQKIKGEVLDLGRQAGADVCVSINWVSILHDDFIDLFPHGVLNAHFGDLPRYRGNAVINWAILQGEQEVCLTVHKMVADELDAGDIALKVPLRLEEKTTISDIVTFARENVPSMFCSVLHGMQAGTQVFQSQQDTGLDPMRCYPRLPQDGLINWKLSAVEINALVRSLTKPYSGAYTYWRRSDTEILKVGIWQSRVISDGCVDLGVPGHVILNDPNNGESWIYTGKGILAVSQVNIGESQEIVRPGSVWKSIRMRLGLNMEDEIYRLYKTS